MFFEEVNPDPSSKSRGLMVPPGSLRSVRVWMEPRVSEEDTFSTRPSMHRLVDVGRIEVLGPSLMRHFDPLYTLVDSLFLLYHASAGNQENGH